MSVKIATFEKQTRNKNTKKSLTCHANTNLYDINPKNLQHVTSLLFISN